MATRNSSDVVLALVTNHVIEVTNCIGHDITKDTAMQGHEVLATLIISVTVIHHSQILSLIFGICY